MTEHVERPRPCVCPPADGDPPAGPSSALLERARVGWERFLSSFGDPSDG